MTDDTLKAMLAELAGASDADGAFVPEEGRTLELLLTRDAGIDSIAGLASVQQRPGYLRVKDSKGNMHLVDSQKILGLRQKGKSREPTGFIGG